MHLGPEDLRHGSCGWSAGPPPLGQPCTRSDWPSVSHKQSSRLGKKKSEKVQHLSRGRTEHFSYSLHFDLCKNKKKQILVLKPYNCHWAVCLPASPNQRKLPLKGRHGAPKPASIFHCNRKPKYCLSCSCFPEVQNKGHRSLTL